METLQILGWVYLGIMLGSVGGIMAISIFQSKRVAQLLRAINDLEFKNKILMGENKSLSYRGKQVPRKKRNWNKKPTQK